MLSFETHILMCFTDRHKFIHIQSLTHINTTATVYSKCRMMPCNIRRVHCTMYSGTFFSPFTSFVVWPYLVRCIRNRILLCINYSFASSFILHFYYFICVNIFFSFLIFFSFFLLFSGISECARMRWQFHKVNDTHISRVFVMEKMFIGNLQTLCILYTYIHLYMSTSTRYGATNVNH